jgi:hypothetical protein
VDLVFLPGQMPLDWEKDALTRADDAEQELLAVIRFMCEHNFGDSAGELTTLSTSSMKGGNSGHNGSNLDKGNILKPTFDTLMKEGRKAFKAYRTNLEELFPSGCEMMR